jgi:DNA-binding FrmR family transcriptional regulator
VTTELKNERAKADILNRLRRSEGQIRGIQRMVEAGKSCLQIGQQFAAVRSALDNTYIRMTVCYMEQELDACTQTEDRAPDVADVLKNMEKMLARIT